MLVIGMIIKDSLVKACNGNDNQRLSGQKYVFASHSSRVSQSARVWFTWGEKWSKSTFVLNVKRKGRSETKDKERKEIVE